MTTEVPLLTKQDLSDINNLKDLKKEIAHVKALVQAHEADLKERAKKIPAQFAFIAVEQIVHVAVKQGVPSNIFGLVRNAIGLMMNIRRQQKGMRGIISQVKELIIFTALNKLVRIYQQRRYNKTPEENA
jgi:hypothetical protein